MPIKFGVVTFVILSVDDEPLSEPVAISGVDGAFGAVARDEQGVMVLDIEGDKVVTRGGVIGTIHAIADNVVTLEVADNVRIKFSRDAIAGVQGAQTAENNS